MGEERKADAMLMAVAAAYLGLGHIAEILFAYGHHLNVAAEAQEASGDLGFQDQVGAGIGLQDAGYRAAVA